MPFVNPISSVCCLFCGHKFHLSQAWWRNLKENPTERKVTQDKLNLDQPPVLSPEQAPSSLIGLRRFWVGQNVPDHWIKVCPECLLPLPGLTAAGYSGVERIAVIGGPTSGKSNLIWALIQEARRGCASLGLTAKLDDVSGPPDYRPTPGEKVWRTVYDDPIQAGKVIDKTQIGHTFGQAGPIAPLILRIRATHRPVWHHLLHPWDDFRPVDLILFDRAGETLIEPSAMRQFASYVLSATAFIFLVDPTACDEFVPHLESKGSAPSYASENKSRKTDLGAAHQVLLDAGLVSHSRKARVEAAVVVTKADLLRSRFRRDNPWATWDHPPDYRRGFDALAARSASADIREYLRGQSGEQIVNEIESTFSTVQYFACSALGRDPHKTQLNGPAIPFRVLDPLLWLLNRRGYIPTAPIAEGLEDLPAETKAKAGKSGAAVGTDV